MFFKRSVFFFLCLHSTFLFAQLPFGHEQAIFKDSNIFISWASGYSVNRGLQDITDSSLGFATAGDATFTIGKADGSGVVSLGDGGTAILTFPSPIINGAGYDFAVFENGFPFGIDSLFFLELAFVEVSSDGQNYFRFPATSLTDTITQIDNAHGLNPKALNNLAGKYSVNYGTPFDLDELKNSVGLDINNITHVKIIDIVGSIDNSIARRDSVGRKINDPWPTPFASSGFDLDAIGVIHQKWQSGNLDLKSERDLIIIFPVPAKNNDELHFLNPSNSHFFQIEIFDITGKVILMQPFMDKDMSIGISQFPKGMYHVKIIGKDFVSIIKIVIE